MRQVQRSTRRPLASLPAAAIQARPRRQASHTLTALGNGPLWAAQRGQAGQLRISAPSAQSSGSEECRVQRARPRPRTSAPSALRLPHHQVSVPNPYIPSRCKSSRSHQRPRHHTPHQAERILQPRFIPCEFAAQAGHGCFAWLIAAVRARQSLESMYTSSHRNTDLAITILSSHPTHHLRLLRPL